MPASTFSIVACDLERREWGVAVASRFLAIGAVSPWARPEIGAVATQSWINPRLGEEGLALLAGGLSARDALDRLVAGDEGRAQRQVGIVDAAGRVASYTGQGCLDWAGERLGPGYAAQGNMLVSAATLDALAAAFASSADRPLAQRLLAAMAAAQDAGGDRRGQQSAALQVVRRGAGYGGGDALVDLRVDDHPEPLAELRRLSRLHELHFGATPREQWVVVDERLAEELRTRLGTLGHATGDLGIDLETWAGVENLEERVDGAARIDPVVLEQIRQRREETGP